MPKSIALVGLPGSGKSTVGRALARRLDRAYVDSDQVIESRIGMPIRDYFEREGEPAFRVVEEEVIAALTAQSDLVLATGGGAVISPATRERLKWSAHVVYLRAAPGDLFRRLKRDTSRPLLQVEDPLARLQALFAQRDPYYREVATFTVDTGRPSVSSLVNMVVMQLELSGVLLV